MEIASWLVGSVVLHALWQGVLIGVVIFVALAISRSSDAASRYAISLGGLFGFMAMVVVTSMWLVTNLDLHSTPSSVSAPVELGEVRLWEVVDASDTFIAETATVSDRRRLTVFLAWAWASGIALLTIRLLLQWRRTHRFRNVEVLPPTRHLADLFDRVKSKLSVDGRVELRISRLVDSPMVLGWLRPIIVLPTSTFTSLTPDQLETILTHELIHLARRDHLVNMVQAFIEIALFFHPVTWWLSRQIRVERENCCDDATLEAGGSPRNLAEALLALEALRIRKHTTQAALAATGGSLMNRIERLFESNRSAGGRHGWRMMSACAAVAMGGLLVGMPLVDTPSFAQDASGRRAEAKKVSEASTTKSDAAKRQARIDARMKMMAEDLRKQVAAGELTMEEADATYSAAEERMMRRVRAAEGRAAATPDKPTVDLAALKAQIDGRLKMLAGSLKKQVAAGEMTAEDGEKKFKEAESRMWARYRAAEAKAAAKPQVDLDDLKSQIEERLKTLGRSLRKQVAAGEMSAEDARKKFADAEARMWARYRAAESAQAGTGEDDMSDLRALRTQARDRLAAYSDLLQKRVEAGELTVEEAEAEYKTAEAKVRRRVRSAYEKRTAVENKPAAGGADLAELKSGIEARLRKMGEGLRRQVAAGELTAEEAKEKYEAAERQMWTRYRAAESKKD